MKSKVITFGEIMLRLSPPGNYRVTHARNFDAFYGGSESNVAMALAQFGLPVDFVTRLPNNDLGKAAFMELIRFRVGIDHIIYGGERLGAYFLEQGSSIRGSKVIYDRSNSAFAGIEPGMLDWEEIFKDARIFHWSGITPALSDKAFRTCKEALEAAKSMGLIVSVDLNPRKKLWQYGISPQQVMPELIQYCDIMLTDLDTASEYLLTESPCKDYSNVDIVKAQYQKVVDKYPNLGYISTTLRYSIHTSHQQLSGVLFTDGKLYRGKKYDLYPIVDRVGGGDAYMAGLAYGYYNNFDPQKTLEFAIATSALKHTTPGDYSVSTVEEINSLIEEGLKNISR